MERSESDAAAIRRSTTAPAAFEAVFARRFDAVHGYLRRRLGDDLADELAAEVFARAFARRATFVARHPSALPWLLGIASNLIADHHRAERRRWRALEREAARTPSAVDHAGGAAERQLDPALAAALRRLPAHDRDALLLLAWGELSYEEAADALAVPVGTVRSRVSRARRRLADRLGEELAPIPVKGESHA